LIFEIGYVTTTGLNRKYQIKTDGEEPIRIIYLELFDISSALFKSMLKDSTGEEN